jgi:MFS family permease
MFFVHQRGSANAVYFIAVMVGSFLTPMAAGAQAATQGWRWSYYALSIALTGLFFVFVVLFEETKYIPVTVGARDGIPQEVDDNDDAKATEDAKKDPCADLEAIKSNLASDEHIPLNTYRQRLRLVTKTSESLIRTAILPVRVISLPHVAFTALQFASGVCWLVLYLTATSVIFSMPPYNFSTAGVGYMNLGPFVGNVLGSIYGGPFADWLVVRLARRNGGIFEPEMRLYPLILTVITMAGGLVMFGVTADRVSAWVSHAWRSKS